MYNNVSVGCQKGKRPWTVTYTSTTNGSDKSVQKIKRQREVLIG